MKTFLMILSLFSFAFSFFSIDTSVQWFRGQTYQINMAMNSWPVDVNDTLVLIETHGGYEDAQHVVYSMRRICTINSSNFRNYASVSYKVPFDVQWTGSSLYLVLWTKTGYNVTNRDTIEKRIYDPIQFTMPPNEPTTGPVYDTRLTKSIRFTWLTRPGIPSIKLVVYPQIIPTTYKYDTIIVPNTGYYDWTIDTIPALYTTLRMTVSVVLLTPDAFVILAPGDTIPYMLSGEPLYYDDRYFNLMTTGFYPDNPIKISPDSGSIVKTNSVKFLWHPVSGVSKYLIYICNSSAVIFSDTLTDTSFIHSLPNGNYRWSVLDVGFDAAWDLNGFTVNAPISVITTPKINLKKSMTKVQYFNIAGRKLAGKNSGIYLKNNIKQLQIK